MVEANKEIKIIHKTVDKQGEPQTVGQLGSTVFTKEQVEADLHASMLKQKIQSEVGKVLKEIAKE